MIGKFTAKIKKYILENVGITNLNSIDYKYLSSKDGTFEVTININYPVKNEIHPVKFTYCYGDIVFVVPQIDCDSILRGKYIDPIQKFANIINKYNLETGNGEELYCTITIINDNRNKDIKLPNIIFKMNINDYILSSSYTMPQGFQCMEFDYKKVFLINAEVYKDDIYMYNPSEYYCLSEDNLDNIISKYRDFRITKKKPRFSKLEKEEIRSDILEYNFTPLGTLLLIGFSFKEICNRFNISSRDLKDIIDAHYKMLVSPTIKSDEIPITEDNEIYYNSVDIYEWFRYIISKSKNKAYIDMARKINENKRVNK